MTTMSKLKYVSITETQTKIYILCSGWVFGEYLSGTSLKYLKFGNFDQQKFLQQKFLFRRIGTV